MRGRLTVLLGVLSALLMAQTAIAAFPGTNGKIAYDRYASDPSGTSLHVFTINPDGTGEQSLTPPGGSEHSARWSADGRKIVLNHHCCIATLDSAGGERTVLQMGGEPAWSPDGGRIAFVRGAGLRFDDNGEIFVVNADNTGQANLTGDGTGPGPYDGGPAWSPDGTRIAFNRGGSGAFEFSIYTMGPSGEDRVRLTSGHRDFSPDWSPDGTMIAFQRYAFDGDDADVYVMNADGTGVRQLTNNDVNDEDPAWSPDGTRIAFERDLFPSYRIYTMNADGTDEQSLANGRSADWQPIPNRPPDCSSVTASPPALVRPGGEFRTVTVGGGTDPDGDPLTYVVDVVTQDEPVGRKPDARRTQNPHKLKLRAERDPRADGRVYRIAVTVSDGKGGECSATATVEVRRKKKRPAVDSAPPSYDSFVASSGP